MKKTLVRSLALGALVSLGCADNPRPGDEEIGNDSSDGNTTQDADADADGESGSGSADDADTDASSSDEGTDTDTTVGTTTDDDDDDDDDGPQTKFDLGGVPDNGFMNCGDGGGGGNGEFSYLWAANSDQGTISKINTTTVTEVGRYIVRPDSAGSPSRTSVSLSGNVAVANRNGGVTKIYANTDNCEESNGMPGLQTSNSAAFLPWGQEECVAWYTPFGYQSQRPVAWGKGDFNQGTCTYDNEELWTSGTNGGNIDVILLDGDDGSVKDMVTLVGMQNDFYGIYGAATDGDGNMWGSQLGFGGKLVKVDRDDMSYEIWSTPDGPHWYGMTVDVDGMVWLCSDTAGRFDPMTESWSTNSVGGWTGCMADASENGLLWMSDGSGVVGVNRDTLQVDKTCNAGGSYGISIDFEGYIWAVANGSLVSKIDPETCQTWTYNGLVGAYTYSDMTGYALSNAGTPNG
jgi:hypothetical protein